MPVTATSFLGSAGFARVLADLPLKCLDIGARKGITADLLPLAPAVEAYGFEPDPQECERLNAKAAADPAPWKSLKFLPVALGRDAGQRTLNLYRMRGGSSLLEANLDLLREFARQDSFQLDGTVQLQTLPLDEAARKYGMTDASYLKLDIQGAELEVLQSGEQLLRESVVGVRIEMEYLPIYKGQPLCPEIDSWMRAQGFSAMGMVEARHWRTTTSKRLSFFRSSRPYSRGQIAHADTIYLRTPRLFETGNEAWLRRLLKAGFLALNYECVDYAAGLFARADVAQFLGSKYGIDVERELGVVSRHLGRKYAAREIVRGLKHLGEGLAQGICALAGRPMHVVGRWE